MTAVLSELPVTFRGRLINLNWYVYYQFNERRHLRKEPIVSDIGYEPIRAAVAALASVCDYASSKDSRGFNGTDTWLGHALAATPVALWDADAAFAAWDMTRKYHVQLEEFGIVWDELPAPEDAADRLAERRQEAREGARAALKERARVAAVKAKSYVVCSGEGETVIMAFPYDPEMVDAARRIPGRAYRNSYEGHSKVNVYPFGSLPAVIEFADKHDLTVAPEVRALAALAVSYAAAEVAKAAAKPQVYRDGQKPVILIKADFDRNLNDALYVLNGNYSTWDRDRKVHKAPYRRDPQALLDLIKRFGLRMDDTARELIEGELARQDRNEVAAVALTGEPMDIPGLAAGMALKPLQFPVVRHAIENRRTIIGDEMGFGKSLSALASVAVDGALPAVVLCRPSLTLNWENEIRRFFPGWSVFVAEGTTPQEIPVGTDVVVIGSASFASVPRPPKALTHKEAGLARENGEELIPATRAKTAIKYLLTQPALASVGRIADYLQIPEATLWLLLDAEGQKVTRETECTLMRYARPAKEKAFPWVKALIKLAPKALIIDEGQDTKESTANRSQAAEQLSQVVVKANGLVLDLTGTAIVNRPVELMQQLKILGRISEFGGPGTFLTRYCAGESSSFGTNFNGAHNLIELNQRLLRYGIMIRRTDFRALGLPEFHEDIWEIPQGELDSAVMEKYEEAEADVIEFLGAEAARLAKKMGVDPTSARVRAAMKASAAEHLVRLNALRKLIGEAKRPAISKWIRAQNAKGEKVMVAAHHRPVVTGFAKEFGGLKIQGEQTTAAKETDKARFQNESVAAAPVISVAIAAGGVGHTLTAAKIGIQAEVAWTPGDTAQMGKRLHRIGQAHPVHYTIAIVPGTVDEEIWDVVLRKRDILAAVLDGQEDEGADEDLKSVVADVAWAMAQKGLGK